VAALKGWSVFQLDVKSTFLHGDLNETIYVEQPPGFVKKGEEEKVYRLKKALYGLKHAPRAWYSKIDSYFTNEGFTKSPSEYTLYVKKNCKGDLLIVSLYVDDLIFTGNCAQMFSEFKSSMKKNFDMTDLGKMSFFLGVEVKQSEEGISMSQAKYAREILSRFRMENCKPVLSPIVPGSKLSKGGEKVDETYYKQMVGSLMYLTATRPDIMYVVSLISRYMDKPT